MILILAALVYLLVREWTEASIILLIILACTLLSFGQEYRANAARGSPGSSTTLQPS